MEENKKNKMGLGVLIGILVALVIGMGAFIVCDKVVFKEDNKQEKCEKQDVNNQQTQANNQQQDNEQEQTQDEIEEDKEEKTCEECPKVKAPVCTGTYYGETSDKSDNGFLSYDYKYTYVLKEDGTFTADFSGASATAGTFVINGNTISLTGYKDTVGPEDVVTHYATRDLIIAKDCSYIQYEEPQGFKLYRK